MEAEKAAVLMGLSLEDFFQTYLSIDWYEPDKFVLAPAVKQGNPGDMYDSNPKGECVFYQNQRCTIYKARPYECSAYHHSETHPAEDRHEAVADAWQTESGQEQIKNLLGEEPYSSSYSIFEAMNW